MVANPDSGFASLKDLEGRDRRRSPTAPPASAPARSSPARCCSADAGVDGEAVPFDGGAPALTAVLGGQVDTACLQIGEAIENIESGKIVPLTVFGAERVEYLPDVPTAQEQGLDVEVAQYRFMTVPKGTPQDVRTPSPRRCRPTFETEEYQEFNEQNSLTPMEIPGDEVVAQLEEDKQRYADLVEEYDINLAED